MKRIFLGLLLMISFLGFSQKVKLKKNIVLIDDVEVYKFEEEGNMLTLSTLASEEFSSMIFTSYQADNPARKGYYGYKYPAMITAWIVTLKFPKTGKELYTDLSKKDIIKSIFKSNIVDQNGKIDEEKLEIFINKYNNENLKYKLVN